MGWYGGLTLGDGSRCPVTSRSAIGVQLAALAPGESTIRNLPSGEDVRSTARCLRGLGVAIQVDGQDAVVRSDGTSDRPTQISMPGTQAPPPGSFPVSWPLSHSDPGSPVMSRCAAGRWAAWLNRSPAWGRQSTRTAAGPRSTSGAVICAASGTSCRWPAPR